MKSNANLNMNFENITVNPIAGALGAQIDNVDLSENLPDEIISEIYNALFCLLYTSPSPRDISGSRMPSSA